MRPTYFPPTTPSGSPTLTFKFGDLLTAMGGLTIVSAVVAIEVAEGSKVDDPSPNDRLDGDPVIVGGINVLQDFAGGIAGVDYVITCDATLSDGQVEPLSGILPVRRFVWGKISI